MGEINTVLLKTKTLKIAIFINYLRTNKDNRNAAYELKYSNGN